MKRELANMKRHASRLAGALLLACTWHSEASAATYPSYQSIGGPIRSQVQLCPPTSGLASDPPIPCPSSSGGSNAAAAPQGSAPTGGSVTAYTDGNGNTQYVTPVKGLPTTDPNNASFGGNGTAPAAVTVGTAYTAARSLQFNCTTGGTVTFVEDGVSVNWIVGVGTTEIPHTTTLVSSLGTAPAAVCPNIYAHY